MPGNGSVSGAGRGPASAPSGRSAGAAKGGTQKASTSQLPRKPPSPPKDALEKSRTLGPFGGSPSLAKASTKPMPIKGETVNVVAKAPPLLRVKGQSVDVIAYPSNDQLKRMYDRGEISKEQAVRGQVANRLSRPPKPAKPDILFDGYLIGGSQYYPRGTQPAQLRGVPPERGDAKYRIIFINGINTSLESHRRSQQALANKAGAEVVGVYNATEGILQDLRQSAADKLSISKNPATKTLADLVYQELKRGAGPVRVVAHSQGAISASNAMPDIERQLRRAGYSRQQRQQMLSRVRIDTFGGAALTYKDGANYHHYVNRLDIVPLATGQGGPLARPTKGGKVTLFTCFHDTPLQHSFEDVYLRHWKPSE